MDVASGIVNGKRIIIEIRSNILSGQYAETEISDLRCSCCNAPASFVHDDRRELHFRAHHEPDCIYVKDGRNHKVNRVAADTLIDDIETILNHTDSAPVINPTPRPKKPKIIIDPPDEQNEIDDIDIVVQYETRMIHTVGGIYKYIQDNGLDANIGNGLTGRDLLLTPRVLRDVRRYGMNGMRIAITKRINPKSLEHPFDIPDGYTCLCDMFATDQENAIFFLVKLSNKLQNDVFKSKIMGDYFGMNVEKDTHDNIILLGNWSEEANDFYNVYKSGDINSHCYKFVTYNGVQ